MNRDDIYYFIENNFRGIIGAIIGLIFALIFVLFGFWRGILIILFVTAGYFIGNNYDRKDFYRLLEYIFPPWS
ncbi:DUF2273 domain-containing protein [Natranaerofaba carboxydovora]|uniref:DUF2273 domain-containing protein n=1 Tax=Natranaerofaba carboxydovora TaxID=2742683 RepID=UPI001F149739|nr:DUF2273 domain-containing protein [Natranaerofaba carboxydovora]UMZ73953.1 hypothetical protein ACONDI_01523 [Natranaerofaba carboxydovora]